MQSSYDGYKPSQNLPATNDKIPAKNAKKCQLPAKQNYTVFK